MNLDVSNNPLQDALYFKPLPPKQHPNVIDETTGLEREIIKQDESSPVNSLPFKGVSLKDYESQRRIIEEQNKQKKEILYKAIEQQ